MRPSLKRHVLVQLRQELGLTQKDFADHVGCSESTLEAVERGPKRLKLSAALAEKIFLATGVSPDWLLANDFAKPMTEGMHGQPYTKRIFEEIEANRAKSDGEESFGDRIALIRAVETLLGSFLAAENKNMQSAAIVRYRFQHLAEQLKEEFGWDKFSYSVNGQKPWDRIHKAIYAFFHAANPKPVPMADGTMQLIDFEKPYHEQHKPKAKKQ